MVVVWGREFIKRLEPPRPPHLTPSTAVASSPPHPWCHRRRISSTITLAPQSGIDAGSVLLTADTITADGIINASGRVRFIFGS